MFHGIHVPQLGLQQCAVACPSQFSSLVKHHHLREMTMYYDPEQLKFFCVVSLGTDVCGFPTIVHGGLTAGGRSSCMTLVYWCIRGTAL